MVIRTANVMDIDKILLLENQVFDLHIKARPDMFKKNPLSHDYIKDIIDGNKGKIFVAEDDKEIIGYCIIFIREVKNHYVMHDMINIKIDDLCVDEKYRQKGIGRKLFEAVKMFAKEKNAKFIELTVWELNKNAKEFYKHLGMKTRINNIELEVE